MDYSIAITTLKQADPILAAVIDRVGECALKQEASTGDLLDSLVRSIIYQQLSGKASRHDSSPLPSALSQRRLC